MTPAEKKVAALQKERDKADAKVASALRKLRKEDEREIRKAGNSERKRRAVARQAVGYYAEMAALGPEGRAVAALTRDVHRVDDDLAQAEGAS